MVRSNSHQRDTIPNLSVSAQELNRCIVRMQLVVGYKRA